MFEEFDENQSR